MIARGDDIVFPIQYLTSITSLAFFVGNSITSSKRGSGSVPMGRE